MGGEEPKVSECPVNHTGATSKTGIFGSSSSSGGGCPVEHKQPALPSSSGCPIDHSNMPSEIKASGCTSAETNADLSTLDANTPSTLANVRERSSIPRADGSLWEYPSEKQFYRAMQRKHMNPDAGDMPVVIPIHNAVNEKCWFDILKWEKDTHSPCDPKLVKFSGTKKLSPRAVWNMAWGASRPFDRHDWVVDRCGKQVDYVIDFYTGAPDPANPLKQSFYLDVRPKLNSFEGIKMRFCRFWGL